MGSTVTSGERVLTGDREAALAAETITALRGPGRVLAIEGGEGPVSPLPPELGLILQHVIEVMSTGGTVTVSAIPEIVTTTTAASILNMSRPTLMGLIRDGELPAHKVGAHHRLKASDVFRYQRSRRARERAAFESLRELDNSEE